MSNPQKGPEQPKFTVEISLHIKVLVCLPETILLLIIFPPSVASDFGTTVMMLPLVVFTYVAAPGVPAIRAPIDGLTVGRVYGA